MFTGIIESTGKIVSLKRELDNLHITLKAPFTRELKIDQSVAHNGVCLTVVTIKDEYYTVTAIRETLEKTNLANLKTGESVNLERCVKVGDRLDGHIVQGHVDTTAICRAIEEQNGSWMFKFSYKQQPELITVSKGSICVNGVSLTVVESGDDHFSVAIIPYTFENTNFKDLRAGDTVNIEFDIVGKYVARLTLKQQ